MKHLALGPAAGSLMSRRSFAFLIIALGILACMVGRAACAAEPLRVYILAGQSNMEGKAKMELLNYQAEAPETKAFFAPWRRDGQWVVRDDVWINFLNRRGPLTVGFGSPNCVGPEWEFGRVMGDHCEEPVLIIKAAWGGKSLARDFRPPGAGLPEESIRQALLDRTNADRRKREQTEWSMADLNATYGHYYREMLREVRETLDQLPERFPELKDRSPTLAGLVWFQGWNDMFDADGLNHYADCMAAFIRDARRDLQSPNLPVVIGQMGQGGPQGANEKMQRIKDAQAAMERIPEFQGNVAVVRTDVFWDLQAAALIDGWRDHEEAWKKVGSDYAYHYLGSAITFGRIGRAFGEAMISLTD